MPIMEGVAIDEALVNVTLERFNTLKKAIKDAGLFVSEVNTSARGLVIRLNVGYEEFCQIAGVELPER